MSKKLICLVSLVVVLNVAGTVSADLVAHWRLDEGSGTFARDSSGNNNHGTVMGDAQWVAGGKLGGALAFDGVNDIVVVEQNSGLPIYNNATDNAWSVAMWVKGGPQNDMRVFSEASTTDNNPLFNLGTKNDGATGQLDVYIRPAGLEHTFSVAEPFDDTWHHIAWVDENGTARLYVDGVLDGGDFNYTRATLALDTTTIGGILRAAPSHFFTGQIDDVQIYSRALADVEILGVMSGAGAEYPLASGPTPVDGAMLEATWVNLGWRAGDFAVSHDVYLGDNFEDVDNGAASAFQGNLPLETTSLIAGFAGFAFENGLVPGTTYYWRIDEVNDADPNSPWKGNIWSFWIPPRKAYNASPADGVGVVQTNATVSWAIGFNGKLSQMYFGTDAAEVDAGTGGTAKGPVVSTTYDPGPLAEGTTYYWRVDQFDGTETHKGDVWSVTTVPVVAVTDPDLVGWWTMEQGAGTVVVDQSGSANHGSFVGDIEWADGYQGTALEFAGGSATSPTYVDFGDASSLQLTGSVSISAWVKMNPGNAGAYMGIGGKLISGVYKGYSLVRHSSNVFRLWCDDGAGVLAGHEASSNVAYTDTEWHHVVGVVDGVTSSLYVDGVEQAQHGSVALTESGGIAYIGKQYGDNSSHRYWNGLIDDVRIYSKALTDAQIAEVMRGNKKLAGSPSPSGDSIVDIRDISSLSFSAGDGAASHDVYFGQDRDTVAGADNSSPEFQGNQAATSLSAAGLVEFGGGDYYWRVDEVAADGTFTAGTIWKFTVPGQLVVDDFESYNDLAEDDPASNRIYLTWIDGFGTTTNGSQAGNLDVPLMAPGRDSSQAMPLGYDNAGKTSEATLTLVSNKDWTEQGVTKLVVWFSGDSANAADRMFVALGNAVVYHPDDAATQTAGWNEWAIDLQEFANQGADLANVGSITLGFGTRNAPVATGGIGTVEIDDIGLIR